MKRLLKNTNILLYDEENSSWIVAKNQHIGISEETICYIGVEIPKEDFDEVKDLTGKLVMPGLYNLHTHTSMVLLRGLGNELPLNRWLTEAMFPMEEKLREKHIALGTQLAMLEMLACGTVSFTDMYFYPHTEAEVVQEAGMKANICRAITAFDPSISYEQNQTVQESISFFDTFKFTEQSRVKADLGIHAEYTSNEELIRKYAEECRIRGARMHLHLSETKKEHEECKQRNSGLTPTEFFDQLGVFENPTIAAHCVWVEEKDIDILSQREVTVAHNPSSNLKLGSGFMPYSKLQSKQIPIGLGTDGAASNNNLNLFEEMNLAALIHKGVEMDPTVVSAQNIITAATTTGAKAQGRENCGKLAVGNKADLIAIDLDQPHTVPHFDILSLLVYSIQASDVVLTMVDGNILYENGEYKTLDEEKIVFEVKQEMEKMVM